MDRISPAGPRLAGLPLLLILTALPLLAVPSQAGNPSLIVSPTRPRQGDALFVRVRGAEPTGLRWLNKDYPVFPDGGEYVGAVPIRPETAPGGHTLVVKLPGGRSLRRVLQVAKLRYPVQHLSMRRSTARLYNYPGVEKEERIIGSAIRTRSAERLWSGDWLMPSRGRISTAFGERRLRNGKAVGRHRGLDIAAPKGAPIRAPADGKVVLAGTWRKHGGTVVIDHGQGVTSLYLHQSRIHAKKGQAISRGEKLGEVGATGVATGPHLHWAVYVHGTPVEPLEFVRLSKRGIRP